MDQAVSSVGGAALANRGGRQHDHRDLFSASIAAEARHARLEPDPVADDRGSMLFWWPVFYGLGAAVWRRIHGGANDGVQSSICRVVFDIARSGGIVVYALDFSFFNRHRDFFAGLQ